MVRELKTVREINKACEAYAMENGRPVYCTVDEVDGNTRVFKARTHDGELQIKASEGWINPTKVFTI